jgi:hypothetical protein
MQGRCRLIALVTIVFGPLASEQSGSPVTASLSTPPKRVGSSIDSNETALETNRDSPRTGMRAKLFIDVLEMKLDCIFRQIEPTTDVSTAVSRELRVVSGLGATADRCPRRRRAANRASSDNMLPLAP